MHDQTLWTKRELKTFTESGIKPQVHAEAIKLRRKRRDKIETARQEQDTSVNNSGPLFNIHTTSEAAIDQLFGPDEEFPETHFDF